MIAEELLACSLGLELNTDPEPEEKMDENEEESTESPREAAEDMAQVGDFSSYINNVLFISYKFSSTCQFTFMTLWSPACIQQLRLVLYGQIEAFPAM